MHGPIVHAILRLLVTGLSVLVVGAALPGIRVKNYGSALVFALVVGLLNVAAWWLLAPLTVTFAVLTLGLGIILVNALVFLLGARAVDGVDIDGWLSAILASLGVSVVNWVLGWLVGV